jgi:hypothetical protein
MRGRAKRELSALRSSSTAFGEYSKGNDGERIPLYCVDVKLGLSFIAAHIRATTHPINVHPRKRFRRNMAVKFSFPLSLATQVGIKYITIKNKINTPITFKL